MPRKVVIVIAPAEFRDEELFETKRIIENAGITTVLASKSIGVCKGKLGGIATAQITLKDIKVSEYSAIVFIGGGGAECYFDDPLAHSLATEFLSASKIVSAICIAPVILANAGILKGKRATVWQSGSRTLELSGAIYSGNPVEYDGNIITGNGPDAAEQFGRSIVKGLAAL